jgi:hypothetical protein
VAVASREQPPALVRRWEALGAPIQGAIVFPVLAVALFALNLAGFDQPLWRSVLYGLIEAAPFTAIVLIATATERGRRGG